ncbi:MULTISPECIES: carbohydrate ABC transporter permease [unclassified Salinibacterium]|uniref:carbohydrate ABC transporter permease n=1 Tax=unclassified Salinibacterium TaxID=2632331 RepID=UPI0018CED8F5|nr:MULTISPECIES: carbohydrate ABC transporter permease [unclassified Salinibacterium]MBH0053905.1 carbohydrate ABC transporter permease [Salinibacterium sp. SWN139]MBH0083187.1 carbohydrate ABC transporter permease [Salinibacterium sp. SWN167]MBH0115773.1 carbohydrate ABC transporter permease [Salinibacterium sp. NG253]MBH0129317.1 carbohydrate ABC transporter permease [Salinibacterium sp. NK8237]
MAKSPRTRPRSIVLHVVVIAGAIAMFFPFLWTFITSITPGAGFSIAPQLWPENPSFEAYQTLFTERPFGRVVANSIGLALVTTLAQLFTSATAAYAFSRLPFRGRGVVFAVYLATMMIPLQVLIVPLFAELKAFGLLDTYLGALLPTFASAFGIFLLRQAVNQVPRELDEAAKLDGAGHFRVFTQIIIPNIRPALATLTVFAFMSSWNAFLWPLVVLRSPELQTLPIALAGLQGQYTTAWDVVMAGSIVSILPMLALYIFAQKYIIQGVASSGIK